MTDGMPPSERAILNRRVLLAGSLSVGLVGISSPVSAQSSLKQPARPTPRAFMAEAERQRALALKAGDQGFGAVVVKGSGRAARIVGLGPSRVVSNTDPTAHAEMEAIRDACRRLKTRDLSDCILYSTFRPCRMCETGAYWAGVARMIHGSGMTNAGRPRYGC